MEVGRRFLYVLHFLHLVEAGDTTDRREARMSILLFWKGDLLHSFVYWDTFTLWNGCCTVEVSNAMPETRMTCAALLAPTPRTPSRPIQNRNPTSRRGVARGMFLDTTVRFCAELLEIQPKSRNPTNFRSGYRGPLFTVRLSPTPPPPSWPSYLSTGLFKQFE